MEQMKYDKAREKELKNKIIEASIKEEIQMIIKNFLDSQKLIGVFRRTLISKRR